MKEMVKPGLILLIITLVAAAFLGFVFTITQEPILRQQALTQSQAMTKILPAKEYKEELPTPEPTGGKGEILKIFTAYYETEIQGYIFKLSQKGYGGAIDLFVGIDKEGKISGVQITKHSETPGLGANAQNPKFTDKFIGKAGQLKVVKSAPGESDIEAITSATITSRAVTDAVNLATAYYEKELKGVSK